MLFTKILKEKIPYTGSELAPHWISGKTGEFASSIVAFRGACLVETGELVDLEDSREKETIVAEEMLHFLGEWFDGDLMLESPGSVYLSLVLQSCCVADCSQIWPRILSAWAMICI